MTLARDGLREILILTLLLVGSSVALAIRFPPLAPIPIILWLAVLAFFRVPRREIPSDSAALVAPADGRIDDITRVEHDPLLGGPALRIGIFLSVFDVHVNRAPCAATVRRVTHNPGEFLDARDPAATLRNEHTVIELEPAAPLAGPIIVRQIAGLIARRIVCRLSPGQSVTAGQLFGLIKFGSRTELLVPADRGYAPAVRLGDRVAGGSSILFRLQPVAGAQEPSHEDRQPPRARIVASGTL